SLSPSIHSILACELDKDEEAMDFFGFATRLDLDDYNRNTREGLHMTSIAAAWMNIVYGFLGLRSDTPTLSISPKIPTRWKAYSVNLVLPDARLRFRVSKSQVEIAHLGKPVDLDIWGKRTRVDRDMVVTK
ncbi:MAG: glycosyl hydrolase family 65 protein, partial [Candidatus Enteromonas sp.]